MTTTERKPTPVEEATIEAIAQTLADGAPVTTEREKARDVWIEVVEPLRIGAMSLGVDLALRRASTAVGILRNEMLGELGFPKCTAEKEWGPGYEGRGFVTRCVRDVGHEGRHGYAGMFWEDD